MSFNFDNLTLRIILQMFWVCGNRCITGGKPHHIFCETIRYQLELLKFHAAFFVVNRQKNALFILPFLVRSSPVQISTYIPFIQNILFIQNIFLFHHNVVVRTISPTVLPYTKGPNSSRSAVVIFPINYSM